MIEKMTIEESNSLSEEDDISIHTIENIKESKYGNFNQYKTAPSSPV